MGTIIQGYGPIYGEPVNGTVQGRPNGSYYVPVTNTVDFEYPGALITNVKIGDAYRVRFCDESRNLLYFKESAVSQDLSSNLRDIICSDATLETVLGSSDIPAGQFNVNDGISFVMDYELDSETTYYLAVQLVNNGVPVATSEVVECTVVSP